MPLVKEVKVCLLGDSAVGKTHLARKYVDGHVDQSKLSTTIGAGFLSKDVVLNGITFKYRIWDTAGEERFRSIMSLYYRGAQAAIIVFDVTDQKSQESIEYWLDELKAQGPPNIIIVILGNKIDLRSTPHAGPSTYMRGILSKNQDLIYLESSALTGANVNEVFTTIGEALCRKNNSFIRRVSPTTIALQSSISVPRSKTPTSENSTHKKCCSTVS